MVAPVRVLFLCFGDDQYHNHKSIGAFLNGFLSERGYDVVYLNDAASIVPTALTRCDVIVMYAVNASLPKASLDLLLRAVSGARLNDRGRPVGFAGIHGVTTSFQDSEEFKRMIGATFVSHPDAGPAYEFTVKDESHPVTKGVRDFKLRDELYFFDYHSPFTTLVSCFHENVERPVVWTRQYGQGDVFYIALGHGLEQMRDPNFQTLLVNGIDWSAGEQQAISSG